MYKMFVVFVSFIVSLAFSYLASATPTHSIRILGFNQATVTTKQIKLADIANVSSLNIEDEDTVLALKNIDIAKSPQPGQKIKLTAQEILNKLQFNGVDLQQVGFSFQREMTIERAARLLSESEVRTAIESYLKSDKKDVVLRDIRYRNNIKLAPGITTLNISSYETKIIGHLGFNIEAKVKGEDAVNFTVMGIVDEWKELPVAARPIKKGSIIDESDIVMARLNIKSLPLDTASHNNELIGLEVEDNISVGEVFKRNKLVYPPVIRKGEAVTILYKKGLLSATATGIALEDAGDNEIIKVRNTSSKKIISGTVVEAGLVRVN